MAYRLEFAPAFLRSIQKIPAQIQSRILSRLELLKSNPRPAGSIKLTGEDAYRIRIGDYRVIYAISDEKLVVFVIDAGHRREVYRKR